MNMPKTTYFLFIYALFLFGGGLAAYIQARSVLSLSISTLFGALLLLSGWIARKRPNRGYLFSFFLCLILQGVFLVRFAKTLQLFPAGFFGFLTLFLLSVLAYKLWRHR